MLSLQFYVLNCLLSNRESYSPRDLYIHKISQPLLYSYTGNSSLCSVILLQGDLQQRIPVPFFFKFSNTVYMYFDYSYKNEPKPFIICGHPVIILQYKCNIYWCVRHNMLVFSTFLAQLISSAVLNQSVFCHCCSCSCCVCHRQVLTFFVSTAYNIQCSSSSIHCWCRQKLTAL